MAKSNKVLSIDITNESITIIELTASAKKQTMIHNIIIFETPEDSYEDGVLKEPEKIAEAITQQLMARGINNKNAIFVLSSTKIVNRELMTEEGPAPQRGKICMDMCMIDLTDKMNVDVGSEVSPCTI